MKRTVFSFIAFFLAFVLQAQKPDDSYLSTKLISGYPPQKPISMQNLSDIKSATLETGIDSIQIFFGTYSENDAVGYWAFFYSKKNKSFQMFELQPMDSTRMLSGDLIFRLNNSTQEIFGSIMHDPETDEIFYTWLNENGTSKVASVMKKDRPINENQPMPFFNVESLTGGRIALDDFKGKYLVLNWWAISCRPCIAEMPGLNEMVEKYKTRKDVAFVAIAHDNKEKLENFFSDRTFNYEQALSNAEAVALFGDSYPKHIIVDPHGLVTFYLEGGSPEIHHYIEQVLESQLRNNSALE